MQHRLSYDPDDDWLLIHARSPSSGRYRHVGVARLLEFDALPRRGHHAVRFADYFQFDADVPPSINGYSFEPTYHGLHNRRDHARDAQTLRPLPWARFWQVVRFGIGEPENKGMGERDQADYVAENAGLVRDVRTWLASRTVRDASNRRRCLAAYDHCVFTGERQLDCDGSTICEAAHLWPVQRGGPDHLRNLALMSPSFHDAFDSGMLAIGDDFEILRASHLPSHELQTPNNRSARLKLPDDPDLWPDRDFIRRHRQRIFRS